MKHPRIHLALSAFFAYFFAASLITSIAITLFSAHADIAKPIALLSCIGLATSFFLAGTAGSAESEVIDN